MILQILASIALGTASVQQPPTIAHTSDCGVATYYDPWYHGKETATTGVYYDRYKLSAASWHYPLGTWLRVVNQNNGKAVELQVNDRGGYELLDLSEEASIQLGSTGEPDNRSICVEVLQ